MALVDDRTMTMAERARHLRPVGETDEQRAPATQPGPQNARKRVFLLAAFRHPGLAPDAGPIAGLAEDVVAVIGMDGSHQRFEWVGRDQLDSIANPALITPVEVNLALPSPWHADDPEMVTGLVPLAPSQLGDGSLDDDIDHLLAELATSR